MDDGDGLQLGGTAPGADLATVFFSDDIDLHYIYHFSISRISASIISSSRFNSSAIIATDFPF